MTASADFPGPTEGHRRGLGIIARPLYQLRSMPIPYRWEVTRRHPYYQMFWTAARNHHRKQPTGSSEELILRGTMVAILGMIGVSGEPPDPATEFAELEAEGLSPAWLSGAVHPITFGGLASLLVAALPKDALGNLGMRFLEAACDDKANDLPAKAKALNALATDKYPALNTYPNEPIVSVNPAASGRQIKDAVAKLLRQWKEERGLGEQRDRSDKYPEYLRVWDLREGWTGSAYDVNQEHELNEVATELGVPIATVTHHYCNAFELIVGHPYSREMWARVVGLLKLSRLSGNEPDSVSHRRPLNSPTRRPVPEAVLRPGSSNEEGDRRHGVMDLAAVLHEDGGVERLLSDMQALVSQGLSDEEIVQHLELSSPNARELVAYLRRRFDDST